MKNLDRIELGWSMRMIDGAEGGEGNRNLNGKYIRGERMDGSEVGEVNEN